MGLNIKDTETEQLAAEIAKLTGESKTGAIRTALRERKERLHLAEPQREREQIWRDLAEELWAAVPAELLGAAPTQAEQDEILGYGEHGV
jgi:antitoxin VapB